LNVSVGIGITVIPGGDAVNPGAEPYGIQMILIRPRAARSRPGERAATDALGIQGDAALVSSNTRGVMPRSNRKASAARGPLAALTVQLLGMLVFSVPPPGSIPRCGADARVQLSDNEARSAGAICASSRRAGSNRVSCCENAIQARFQGLNLRNG
jgi:hypothetical protein